MSHVQRHRVAEHGTRPKLQRRRSRFPQHLRDGCDQSRAIQGERLQLNLRENNCNLYTLCGILIYECISVSLVPTSASAYPNVFQMDLWKYNLYKLHQRLSIGEYRIAVTKLGDAHWKFSSKPTCISWSSKFSLSVYSFLVSLGHFVRTERS